MNIELENNKMGNMKGTSSMVRAVRRGERHRARMRTVSEFQGNKSHGIPRDSVYKNWRTTEGREHGERGIEHGTSGGEGGETQNSHAGPLGVS